ncbi:hypothetical protein ATDW_26100 [Asticcacaulis sp. DW145]|uniref:hypothetical protein n=1 Tax=Asticcacaulis sp. DW145 TaxID=3095608 RepID=UPI00308F2E8C|nr:hypothetical protein ATDW_26100 [Asticcacaulis sp. DW145]
MKWVRILAATATWIGVFLLPSVGVAATVTVPQIHSVMTGNSSSGYDQVWIRASGNPPGVPAECLYQGWALFYIPDDQIINRDRAMSLFLSAKLTNRPVTMVVEVVNTESDFWGFGITRCKIHRIVMD